MITHKVAERYVPYRSNQMHTSQEQASATAKLFMNGRSQAVRLPKAFRFDTDEVFIERQGDMVILRPKPQSNVTWAQNLMAILQSFEFEPDFVLERAPALPPPKREELFS